MSGRAEFIETNIKRRVLDTRGHVDTLIYALAQYEGDDGAEAFARAWKSQDFEERLRANGIQAAYENAINGAIKIAQELCELEGWTPANQEPTSNEALSTLRENGVIVAKTHAALKDAYEDRGDLQHDYVGTSATVIFESAQATVDAVPLLLDDVHLHMLQRR